MSTLKEHFKTAAHPGVKTQAVVGAGRDVDAVAHKQVHAQPHVVVGADVEVGTARHHQAHLGVLVQVLRAVEGNLSSQFVLLGVFTAQE